ncbi:hypothetical protein DSO57_1002822 [Entomophthora muscae]|uniref:Uncharacterized protein n=1 Tax=Entomophthora muscae TaxID=34485 RepID=A0ACC2RZQ0_9FUNG|nr:hypothetical protein DSO57_1002822 [Entomophthora muscae]
MTPPLTPRPDHPQESVAANESTSIQIFGVIYITLTGLIVMAHTRIWLDSCRGGGLGIMNDISILVLKTQELNPSSLKADQTLQDSPGPADPLSHMLKLLNYSATRRPTTEDFLNRCQSAAELVPMKTHAYKEDVTWLTEVGEGPTANLPRANTGVSKSTLETLESNPDPPKTT